jgi:hypothetical protein
MKKITSLIVLFLGITFYSFSQTGIVFHFKSNNGNITDQLKDNYCMSFTISGLTSENDVNKLKETFSSNSNVKKFEIFNPQTINNEMKARLILVSKDKNKLIELFKSANVQKLVVDKKDYTLDQLDQLKSDLKSKQKKAGTTSEKK